MPTLIAEAACTRASTITQKLHQAVGDPAAAERIARIWPAPHGGYFKLDAPRRNILRLAAKRGWTQEFASVDPEGWALRRLATTLLPDAPAGLVEALRKLGDAELRIDDLDSLIALLNGTGAKVIRHQKELDRSLLLTLEALPEEMRRPRIINQIDGRGAARLLGVGAQLCLKQGRLEGKADDTLAKLSTRLERARTQQAMFRMLVEEIGLQILAPPPIPGAPWFVPINTVPMIRDTALRFRNCLQSRIGWMLKGHAAYYEVVGNETAVVEIIRHPGYGWILGEALGPSNKPLSQKLHQRIKDYLQSQIGALRDKHYDDVAIRLAEAAGW